MNFEYVKRYTLGEEVCNSVSHGLGAVFSVAATTLMIAVSVSQGDWLKLTASIIFGLSLIILYTMSTLYHAITNQRAKEILRVFDHCSIFLLIAGTYTPFTLIPLRSSIGGWLFVAIWAATVFGIILNIISIERFKKLSMICYLAMGWAIIITLKPLYENVALGGILLLVAGGLCYTVGTLFYKQTDKPYMHFVWHLFVLGGSVCHFMSVLLYILL
ncbi:MAG: hemolysin III family protein [Angelakisella sp.]